MAVHWRVYHYAYRSQYKDCYDTGESQRVPQAARLQMPRHRRPVLARSHVEPRQSAVLIVVVMPELEPVLQQPLQPGTEVTGTPPLDLQDLVDRAQGVGDTLLLLDPLQLLGVVALAPVGDQHPGVVVADDLADFLVAVPGADLEDGRRVGLEDHQV